MDISLIISGNLTGFSRFYISPKAKELISEAKFDFDNYNYLTFLSEKGKAYSISFSSSVIAVSLITRILDSFRRPGLLVVSLLLPRHYVIVSNQDRQDKGAIYQLLNKINDKFYERNFLNGMLNQNPVVLMQDYYSEILSGYTLQEDFNQKNINSNIDVTILNKRVGYITSAERDIPLYLSSPYRKNYEGYHYVFFAENAPQNIEEEPDEVVLYKVHINNNNYRLPQLVRLTDKIYRLSPSEGEFDFNQDFTYNEVLSGVAGSQIKGTVEEDTIELSFRFKQEERTIHFVFEDGLEEVPFANIAPVVEYADGSSYNIASDTFTFLGKEIYEPKILKSGKTNYMIKPASSGLDIQRLKDGATCHIQVERCCTLEMSFSKPYDIPKKITIKRRSTGQLLVFDDIKERIYKILPGSLDEWDYMIESESYETVSGHFLPLGSPQHISFKNKISAQPISARGRDDIGTNSRGTKSVTYVSEPTPKTGIRISGGKGSTILEKPVHPSKKRNMIISLVCLAIAVIFCYICWPFEDSPKENVEENKIKKEVVFILKDAQEDIVESSSYNKWIKDSILIFKCHFLDNIIVPNKGSQITYHFESDTLNERKEISITVEFDNCIIARFSKRFSEIASEDTILLEVIMNQLKEWEALKALEEKELTSEKWKEHEDTIKTYQQYGYQFNQHLIKMLRKINKKPLELKNMEFDFNVLSKWDVTLGQCEEIKQFCSQNSEAKRKKLEDDTTVEKRLKALLEMLHTIQNGYNGGYSPKKTNLSEEQKEVIDALFGGKNKRKINTVINEYKKKNKREDKVKSLKDFIQLLKNIEFESESKIEIDFEGVNELISKNRGNESN